MIIEFPMTRAQNRGRKLYLRRGQVVALHNTASAISRILERARVLHMESLAGEKYGLTLDFIAAGEDVTSRRTASRYGAGRNRCRNGRYRGGDFVRTKAEGFFGRVIETRLTETAAPQFGTSFAVMEYRVDFQGIRNWYTAGDLESADRNDVAWGNGL